MCLWSGNWIAPRVWRRFLLVRVPGQADAELMGEVVVLFTPWPKGGVHRAPVVPAKGSAVIQARLDPQSPDWVGAVPVGYMVESIPLVGFDDAPSTPAAPKTEPRSDATEKLTSTPFTSLTDALDDPAHRALIVEHLRSKGISVPGLTDDVETPADAEPVADVEPEVAQTPDKSEAGDGRNETSTDERDF